MTEPDNPELANIISELWKRMNMDTQQITAERLAGWQKKLAAQNGTPLALVGIGHGQHSGKIILMPRSRSSCAASRINSPKAGTKMDECTKAELASIISELWSAADRIGRLKNSIADRDPHHEERKTLEQAQVAAIRAAHIPAHLLR